MLRMRTLVGVAVLIGLAQAACGNDTVENAAETPETPAQAAEQAGSVAATPTVAIVEPADGTALDGPNVRIVLSAQNITIAPATDTRPGTGHHHLFVNVPITAPGEPIPAGAPGIIHLGQAQTSHELTELAAGDYTVIAVIGDMVHRRLDPQAVDTVRFTVR